MEGQLENPGIEVNSIPKRGAGEDPSKLFNFSSLEEGGQDYHHQEQAHTAFPEEPEEESLEEEQEERRPHEPVRDERVTEAILKKRLGKIQREKYQAIEMARVLVEENEQLRREHQVSTEAAMKTHDNKIIQDIERARRLKAEAIESGDVQAQVDADTELSLATAEYKNVENWKAQQALSDYSQQYHQQQRNNQHDYSSEIKHSNMKDWCLNNSYWADETSPSFDEALKYQAIRFSDQIDRELRENGQSHLIGSQQYLDTVERHIDMVKRQDYRGFYEKEVRPYTQPQGYSQQPQGYGVQQRPLTMRASGRPVAAVRGNYSPSSSGNPDGALAKEHMEMMKKWRLPVSESEYKKYVKAYGRPNPTQYQNRR